MSWIVKTDYLKIKNSNPDRLIRQEVVDDGVAGNVKSEAGDGEVLAVNVR